MSPAELLELEAACRTAFWLVATSEIPAAERAVAALLKTGQIVRCPCCSHPDWCEDDPDECPVCIGARYVRPLPEGLSFSLDPCLDGRIYDPDGMLYDPPETNP